MQFEIQFTLNEVFEDVNNYASTFEKKNIQVCTHFTEVPKQVLNLSI